MKREKIDCKVKGADTYRDLCEYLSNNPNSTCDTCPELIKKATPKQKPKEKLRKKKALFKEESIEKTFPIYTLHPPIREFQGDIIESDTWRAEHLNKKPAHMTEIELPGDSPNYIPLICRKGQFEKTKNPIYAIEAFLLAHEAGLYPPLWVLEYMTKVFWEYHNSKGKKSLDKLFELNKRGRHSKKFKLVLIEDRNQMLMRDVFRLSVLGYSIINASEMVVRRLEETDWDKTGLKLESLNAGSIEQIYLRTWKKIFDCKRNHKFITEWLKNNKDAFLNTFPKDCFELYKPLKTKKI